MIKLIPYSVTQILIFLKSNYSFYYFKQILKRGFISIIIVAILPLDSILPSLGFRIFFYLYYERGSFSIYKTIS
jgi:hypothetical protein